MGTRSRKKRGVDLTALNGPQIDLSIKGSEMITPTYKNKHCLFLLISTFFVSHIGHRHFPTDCTMYLWLYCTHLHIKHLLQEYQILQWRNKIGQYLWMSSSVYANILTFIKQTICIFSKNLLLNASDCFPSGTSEDRDLSKLRNIPSLALLDSEDVRVICHK